MRVRVHVAAIVLLALTGVTGAWAKSKGPTPVKDRKIWTLAKHPGLTPLGKLGSQQKQAVAKTAAVAKKMEMVAAALQNNIPILEKQVKLIEARRLSGINIWTGVK